uniref:WGS project CBMG000000000 data, contig CS5907-c001548 n=1 Tax=Fusarium acuminatum CS5907 TaxID=1318461 RepID=A0A096PFL9_9HYPO|nr:unnamed protein product [Fusarium acuminatum CS5907]
MSLCENCQRLVPEFVAPQEDRNSEWLTTSASAEWILFRYTVSHSSWGSFVQSLDHGCPICWTIWRYIRSSPSASPLDEEMASFRIFELNVRYNTDTLRYHLSLYLTTPRHKRRSKLDFYIWKTTEETFIDAEARAPIPSLQNPVATAAAARRWIDLCDARHPTCMTRALSSSKAKTPTRLLDIGDVLSKTWHVIETHRRVPYAALSHRWTQFTPRLTSETQQTYYSCQPDDVLPQNYQDVIAICRALSIQYIWIDSLCIVQGDGGHDFLREAPIMMDIYQYASLTLAICWESSKGTIFRKRQPRSIPRPKSLCSCHKPPPATSSQKNYAFVEFRSDFDSSVSKSPINHRAWVLQERCLSRRILYLGNDQLYWECDGGPTGFVGSEAAQRFDSASGSRQSIFATPNLITEYCWSAMVQWYTQCHLSYEQDRFIAIAGLARVMSQRTGNSYLAGIWLDYWMQDLIWSPCGKRVQSFGESPTDASKNAIKSTRTITAPSWSWLDFDGIVDTQPLNIERRSDFLTTTLNSFDTRDKRPLAILIEAINVPVGSDPFIHFELASLKVKCILIPVEFDDTTKVDDGFQQHQRITFWLKYDFNFNSIGWDRLQLGGQDKTLKQSKLEFELSRPLDTSLVCYLIPLYIYEYFAGMHSKINFHNAQTYGLVVQEVLQGDRHQFIRIGVWREAQFPQLGPIISNTIVRKNIGKGDASTDKQTTTEEQLFESKLRSYAITQVSFPVDIGWRRANQSNNSSDDEFGIDISSCSNDHSAEWTVISLV